MKKLPIYFILLFLFASINLRGQSPLTIKQFTASEGGSMSNAYLIAGQDQAILVDVPMTVDNAQKLIKMVEASGKELTTIFITHAHPDHYLTLSVLLDRFPQAKALSIYPVVEAIRTGGPGTRSRMKSKMGDLIPNTLTLPEPMIQPSFILDQTPIWVVPFSQGESEVCAALYIPAQQALISGDLVYNGFHLVLNAKHLEGWEHQLRFLKTMSIKTIYPGHGQVTDPSVYPTITAYIENFKKVKDQGTKKIKSAMLKQYPNYKMVYFLDLSSEAYAKEKGE